MTDTLSDLQLRLNLDESTGTTLADSSGNGNDATLLGTDAGMENQQAAGPGNLVPWGVEFDGVDRYANAGDIADYAGTTSQFTTMAWVKVDTLAANGFVMGRRGAIVGGSTQWYWRADQASGDYLFGATSGGVYSTTPVALGQWQHVAITVDGLLATIYVNGVREASVTLTLITSFAVDLTLGANEDGTWPLDGTIADPRIYSRALSGLDVAAIFREGRTLDDGCIVHLDQPPSSGTVWADSSGEGNDFTLVGGKTFADVVTQGPLDQLPLAVTLDGSVDYLQGPVLGLTNAYSMGMWFKTGGSLYLLDNRDADNDGIALLMQSSAINVYHNASTARLTSPATYADDVWHHLAVVYDGATISLYMNRVLVASASLASPLDMSSAVRWGGRVASAGSWNGELTSLRIWNRAISLTEIDDHYDQGQTLTTGLVGEWLLDEAEGTVARNGVRTLLLEENFDGATTAVTYGTVPTGWAESANGTFEVGDTWSLSQADGKLTIEVNNVSGTADRLGITENPVGIGLPQTVEMRYRVTSLGGAGSRFLRIINNSVTGFDLSAVPLNEWQVVNSVIGNGAGSGNWTVELNISNAGSSATVEIDYIRVYAENYGTYTGGVTLRETGPGGRYPWAAGFDGVNGTGVTTEVVWTVALPWTVAGWAKADTFGSNRTLMGSSSLNHLIRCTGTGVLNVFLGGATFGVDAWITPYTMPVDEWVHVAVSYIPGEATLYINGEFIGKGTFSAPVVATPTIRWGFRSTSGDVWDGDLGAVRLWNIALDEEDARALWLEGFGGVALLNPAVLDYSLIVDDTRLKPSLTTSLYTGGVPSDPNEVKAGLRDGDDLNPSLLKPDGSLKDHLLRPQS